LSGAGIGNAEWLLMSKGVVLGDENIKLKVVKS
jgi:hypothetical protein